jgi:phosphoesterase RecJ-like protein
MFEDVIDVINRSESFIISGHVNPEGDCVGSLFALAHLIQGCGKSVRIICHDPIPDNLAFLGLTWELMDERTDVSGADCFIAVDTPRIERLGSVARIVEHFENVIVIDHHISCCNFGTVNAVDPQASSCGEMIYLLFKEMDRDIPADIATVLYIALSTDTGSFRYANTTQRTFTIAADLVSRGFDLHSINELVYSNIRLQRFHLFKRFLNNVHFSPTYEIAWSYLSSDDLEACAAQPEDMEGFVGYLRDIRGVRIAFFVFESKKDAIVKCSLRAKGMSDVNALARHFGGGGHAKAAGCKISGSRDQAIKALLEKAEQQLAGKPCHE